MQQVARLASSVASPAHNSRVTRFKFVTRKRSSFGRKIALCWLTGRKGPASRSSTAQVARGLHPFHQIMAPASYPRAQANFPLLLVSADEGDHSSLRQILRQECKLHRVGACSEARSFMRQFLPRIVVCDEVLADGNWRDILGDLQSGPHNPPLIVVSRLADERLWAEVLNLGGYDLLVKPFVASEVTRVVRMAAHRGGQSG